MKYKLLVVDVDGTLLDGKGNISNEDRDALATACRLGVQVCLSTGRVPQACLGVIDQLSLDGYHIFVDGALVSDPVQGSEVYIQPLSKEVGRQAVEFAHRHNLDLEFYSATQYFAEREMWSTKAHRQFFGIEATIIDFTRLWERERIIKGGLVAITPEEAANAMNFCLQFEGRLHFSWARTPAYPGVDFINILAPGVSKGKSLEVLASYLGVSIGEVMAIGDGTNDISLLSTAGLAVAMGNAPDEVKAVADHVTLDVDQSGVAAAIKRFLL